MPSNIILASTSSIRQQLCQQAGLNIIALKADIDERALEQSWKNDNLTPPQLALRLAQAKAEYVSHQNKDAIVIGADQTLSLAATLMHKAKTIEEVREKLQAMRGKTHDIYSAISIAKAGKTLHTTVTHAKMTMWNFSDKFLEDYILTEGEKVKASVGCYQMEGKGITLFEKIEGDYHTILGLPLLALLTILRQEGAIPS